MIDGKFEYYAFISYNREDEKWASWLQHKLEHYKLPSNLNGRAGLPKEIRPVFKDTTELNPGNLPQQIQEALDRSKFLVVVCSPSSARSEWVNKEVDEFLSLGRDANIIPFIVNGTPFSSEPSDECFPKAIRQMPPNQEILGTNINEMGRVAAMVKVVARMTDLKFDMLWQRYERYKRKKRNVVLTILSAFLIAVVCVAAFMWSQNQTIISQYEQLEKLSVRNNALYAMELMKNGELMKAERLIAESCLHKFQENGVNETVEMEKALRRWFRIKYGNSLYQSLIIYCGDIEQTWFSKDGTCVYVCGAVNDGNFAISKYSAETGEKLEMVNLPNNMNSLLDVEVDSALIYLAADSAVHLFNLKSRQDKILKTDMATLSVHLRDVMRVEGDPVLTYTKADSVVYLSNIYGEVLDVNRYKTLPENVDELFCWSGDGRLAFVRMENRHVIFDIQSGKVVKELDLSNPTIIDACFDDSLTAVAVLHSIETNRDYDSSIEVLNLADNTTKGTMEMTVSSSSWMAMSPNGRHFFFSDEGNVHYVDLKSDASIWKTVVDMNFYSPYEVVFCDNGDKMCFPTINCVYLWCFPSLPENVSDSIRFKRTSWSMEKAKGGYTLVTATDNNDVKKTFMTNLKWKWDAFSSVSASRDCEYLAVGDGNVLSVYETQTGKELWTDSVCGLVSGICFSSDNKTLCASGWDGVVRVYDVASGLVVHRLIGSEERLDSCLMSEDDKYVMASDFGGETCLWLISTGELVDVCQEDDNNHPFFPTLSSIKKLLMSQS